MSAPVELAQVWVPLMPEASRLSQGVNRIAGDVERRFGRAGNLMGRKMTAGIEDGAARAKRATADVEKATTALAKARKADEDAAGRVRVAQARLDDVMAKGRATAAQRTTAEEALARAQRARELTASNLTTTEKRLASATEQRAKAVADSVKQPAEMRAGGESAGESFLEGMAGPLAALGMRTGPIGMGIAAAAGVALAGGVVVGRQFWAGMQQEARRDQIQARMGIDDAAMKRYGDIAARAYVNGFGESTEANLSTVASLFEAGILPKDAAAGEVQRTIQHLETAKAILGEDIPQVARAVGQALKTDMADSVEQVTDALIAGQQQGANLAGDWLDTLNEYGTQFRKLGLDAATTTVLVGQMVKAGARDSDVAADALKEFSIRAIDGSKTTVEAYEAMGFSAEEMTATLAAGGPAARDGLVRILEGVKAIPDPAKRAEIAVALFGTQSEDLGDALYAMDFDAVADGMDTVAGSTKRAADTMADNAAAGVERARRAMEVSGARIQAGLAQAAGPALDRFAGMLDRNQGNIVRFFTGVGDVAFATGQDVAGSIGHMLTAFGQMVGGVGNTLGALTKLNSGVQRALGRTDIADQLLADAEAYFGMGEGIQSAGDKLVDFSEKGDRFREEWRRNGERMADVTDLLGALDDAVVELNDNGEIRLRDNTPEVTEALRQLGIRVEELPDGELTVTADTHQGERILRSWREEETGQPIEVPVGADTTPARQDWAAFVRELTGQNAPRIPVQVAPSAGDLILPPSVAPRARGGIDVWGSVNSYADGKLPRTALIQHPVGRRGLVQWAEPETHGEAFIPLNPANRSRSLAIWAETGRRLGAMRSYATGGLNPGPAYVKQLIGQMFPVGNIGGWRPEDGYGEHSTGNAIDVSIPNWQSPQGKAVGDAVAAFALQNADALGLTHLIWQQRLFRPGDRTGSPMPDRGNPTQNHYDHVHAFFNARGGALPTAPLIAPSGVAAAGAASYSRRTPGYNQDGEAGYYTPDPKQIREAEQRVADADQDVREAKARLAELDADAADSQRMSSEYAVEKAEREAQDARTELAEAQRGKFTAASDTTRQNNGQLDGASFARDMLGGAMEFFGFDGDLFSNPFDWGIWKMFTGGANYLGGLLKGWGGSETGQSSMLGPPALRSQHGLGGAPGPGDGGYGNVAFGDGAGSPIGDTLSSLLPNVADFLPNSQSEKGNSYTTNQNSHNRSETGQVFNGPVTINHNGAAVKPQRDRTYTSGLRGVGG